MKMRRIMIRAGMTFAVLLAGLQSGVTAPFCIVGSLNYGASDCSYRTWAECRTSLGGVGDYCETNTNGRYVFDLRDPANPRVVQPAPHGKFRRPR
jgi:hypothetical protein